MPANFTELSRQTVQDFLRTVVIVDDRPTIEPPDLPATTLKTPARVVAEEPAERAEPPKVSASKEDIHDLPIEKFTNGFADIGVFATVVKPDKDGMNEFVQSFVRDKSLGARSDVLILDWVLHQAKQGEKTLEIIESLTASGA